MRAALQESIHRVIRQHELLPARARVVVAVSGGADSVALLHVLVLLQPRWHWTLHIAHLDHHLRGGSEEDARFVQQLGVRWGIGSTIERRDILGTCAREGWSLEDGARRVRYEFLLDVARRQSAGYVVLAHTADDQAETVLMRLLRGTGLLGLSAIPMKRQMEEVWVVRPLLAVWRRELVTHLKQAGLRHQEDASNTDTRFLRNRIRHELLPLLEQGYNPNIKGILAHLAEQSHLDYAYLQEAAGRQWKRVVKTLPLNRVAIAVAPFLRQPKALQRQLVRRAIQRIQGDLSQFEFRHWLEIERVFLEQPRGTRVALPGGVQFRREEERVVCERGTSSSQPARVE